MRESDRARTKPLTVGEAVLGGVGGGDVGISSAIEWDRNGPITCGQGQDAPVVHQHPDQLQPGRNSVLLWQLASAAHQGRAAEMSFSQLDTQESHSVSRSSRSGQGRETQLAGVRSNPRCTRRPRVQSWRGRGERERQASSMLESTTQSDSVGRATRGDRSAANSIQ